MNSTTSPISIATRRDRDTVADTVADAFGSLDVIQYLVPDAGRRRTVTRAWYQLFIDHAIDGAGQVVMIDDRAAAVWLDRTIEPSEPQGYAKRLAAIAGKDLTQFQHLDLQMEANHPGAPHWYLLFAAVRRSWQGKGLGGKLLDYTHARLDKMGYPAYLEATGEDNQRLYQRYGYQNMTPPGIKVSDCISLRRMWRDPVRNL